VPVHRVKRFKPKPKPDGNFSASLGRSRHWKIGDDFFMGEHVSERTDAVTILKKGTNFYGTGTKY